MKKYIRIILSIVVILMFVGCGKKEKHEIEILIPAGSTETFVYSDEEICPTGNKITIWSGAGLSDTEVILKPVEVKQENAYEPTYLTHGMPVKMDVEKGGWFKIGVSVQNDSDRGPIAVSVEVEGVEVRSVEKTEVAFLATILEINNQAYLVEPVVGSNELKSSDQIIVPMKNINPSPEPKVGDIIEIIYDGSIAESYPAQITNVYGIKVVEAVAEEVIVGGDLIPMVMVNGEIYMDTGHESTVEARCGMMDGEITSTVDGTEQPTKDNESNFGTGYGYQYGTHEGLIEIYMNDKWWVFATEKALASSQLMVESEASGETITYNGKEYKTSELCNATLEWLELSEKDRMLSSYFPPEFMIFDEKWGVSLTVDGLTTSGAIIKCTQSGGEATGELHTGSWYILENWTQENGWKEMPYVIDGEIGWNDIAWIIPMNDTIELEVNWEWLYGKLPVGKYRIGKSITDFRESGDYDTATYFVEFEIEK